MLEKLYIQWAGKVPVAMERLAGAGSNREYYRITSEEGGSCIGVVGTSREENHAFITLSRHFANVGLPVPEVFAVSEDEMAYLQSDLGATALFDAISEGRKKGGHYDEHEIVLLEKVMRLLPKIQVEGAKELDFSVCYPQPEFDATNVMFDLNYFKYCFLKPSGVDFHEMRLEEDFRRMARDLTADAGSYFMYRDFQARNIMLDADGSPWLIDYQGGRRGPFYYDVASFLWQASARYSNELRERLIDVYYNALSEYADVPRKDVFMKRLQLFVFFRVLQVLGAYGYRGYFERKKHFLDSIPPALDNLRQLMATADFSYPYLIEVLKTLVKGCLEASNSSTRQLVNLSTKTNDHELNELDNSLNLSTCQLVNSSTDKINDHELHDELLSEGEKLHEFHDKLLNEDEKSHNSNNLSTCQLVNSSTRQLVNSSTDKTNDSPTPKLSVRIFSFSYKKGIPEDESGNGGGYVFDCRSTHNPGRYEPYKKLTGLDEPVIRFLEDDGEIQVFLESVYKLADAHVERYIQRGFTDLMFSFGCTGGQHRSVYSAQHLAEHLNSKYGVEVRLCHREQGISIILNA